MKASESFFHKTRKKSLYNITLIQNIPSIIQNGILCYDRASNIPHDSIDLYEVQARRKQIKVPNGDWLHRYASLYFSFRNPMLYKRKNFAEKICILAVSISALDIEGCVVTDRNAATDLAKFYPPQAGIDKIDFEKVYAEFWTHKNIYEQSNHKAIKCAEVLVPGSVSYDLVYGAYVVSKSAEQKLLETGFDRKIVINPDAFFR